ncbi:MAG: hypothetical protein F6J97_12820 [Leptolyngbya sp. SIO4C1]|nr:hypothetical protein [Leptolyngbya sp. SIO4C1]
MSWLFQRSGSAIAIIDRLLLERRLTVQMDELWTFVDDKGNEQWVWLAIDVETREIVGCHIGDHSGESAKALWAFLPEVYRQCAVRYTDF